MSRKFWLISFSIWAIKSKTTTYAKFADVKWYALITTYPDLKEGPIINLIWLIRQHCRGFSQMVSYCQYDILPTLSLTYWKLFFVWVIFDTESMYYKKKKVEFDLALFQQVPKPSQVPWKPSSDMVTQVSLYMVLACNSSCY